MTLAKRGEVGFHGLGVRGAGGRYHIIGAGVGDEHNDDDIPHTHTHTHCSCMTCMQYYIVHDRLLLLLLLVFLIFDDA